MSRLEVEQESECGAAESVTFSLRNANGDLTIAKTSRIGSVSANTPPAIRADKKRFEKQALTLV